MRLRRFLKTPGLWVLLFASLALLTKAVATQENQARTAGKQAGAIQEKSGQAGREDSAVDGLAARLRSLRRSADAAEARTVFDLLFPPDAGLDPAAEAKRAGLPASIALNSPLFEAKPGVSGAAGGPVMNSGEDEKHPSIDMKRGGADDGSIFVAAEQWAGGSARFIRVGKSPDRGATWPASVLLGDGQAWSKPALRQISPDTLGLVYTRNWLGADQDIFFARVSADLSSAVEVPVAAGTLLQDQPSLATDFPSYAAPYVYIAYSERDGSATRVLFRVSRDLGATWSRPVTVASFSSPGPVDGATALAFDPSDDRLYVAFTAWQGSSQGIAVARSLNFGARWSAPEFVTPEDSAADDAPSLAALQGSVFLAYEHAASLADGNIMWAFSSTGGSTWGAPAPLADGPGDERGPDIRASETRSPGRVVVSYVQDHMRVMVRSCLLSKPGDWTSGKDLKTGPNLTADGAAAVLPGLNPLDGDSVGAAWAEQNPDADIFFGAGRDAPARGNLSVTPAEGLAAAGPEGGAFTPSRMSLILKNTGDAAIDWAASKEQPWLTLSPAGGTLEPGAATTVFVDINSRAEDLAVGEYADTVVLANSTDGTGTTALTMDLTVFQGPGNLAVTPVDGLTASGMVGGPFSPASKDFTLLNDGDTAIAWTVAKTQNWVTLSSSGGSLDPGASAVVTVTINSQADSLAAGVYSDTLTFTNTTNGGGTTTRPVSLTVSSPGALSVTPAGGLTSTGPLGGPFTPASITYTVENTGGTAISWSVSNAQGWVSRTDSGGALNPGATSSVTVYINTGATSFSPGTYTDTVTFTNNTNGTGNTTRPVSLTVTAGPSLSVTPATGLASSGPQGGPFTPASAAYTLQNTGDTSLAWTAAKTQAWVTLSASSGTLAAGATATVTVSVNSGANTLIPGTYTDTVTFSNTTNGSGNTIRSVNLTVGGAGTLVVIPSDGLVSSGGVGGPFNPTSKNFTLQNTGAVAINWTAAKTQTWMTLSAGSGNLAAGATTTVTATINATATSLAAGTYNDTLTFTNTTNGNGNTTRAVTLTVNGLPGALAVTPTGSLSSAGGVGGPFTPASLAYTLQNTGGTSIDWTAVKTQAWVTLSAASGTLAGGATATVTVSINADANALVAGTYSDTVTFTNITNGSGNTYRNVNLTVSTAGTLAVTPADVFTPSGTAGGPFVPASRNYVLENRGATSINWTAAKTQTWLTLSAASGTLAAGASTTVTVTVNSGANTLAAGTYSDTVTFTNTTNGNGNTTRGVTLTVNALAGTLTVSPAGDLASSGSTGGPFTPASLAYTLQNTGGTAINWTAAKSQAWVTLSTPGGTLAAGASATVTVSINTDANALAAGTYNDTVTFANTTNGNGNTTRFVSLSINAAGNLSVAPLDAFASAGTAGGPFTPASKAYTLQNTGATSITWTAAKTQTWLTLSAAGGTLDAGASAIVTASIGPGANALASGTYTDTVTFTNTTNGNGSTTRAVTLTVGVLPGALDVTPAVEFAPSGNEGGPFAPSSNVYTLQNTGGAAISWTAAKTQAWTTLSPTSGTLAAGATATVTLSINATAATLAAGTYNDAVTFTNVTNGSGTTVRAVSLFICHAGTLAVTPADPLASAGPVGGPFTPASIIYTLRNTGCNSLDWTLAKTQAWTTLSDTGGTLASGAQTTVTVSINSAANALAAGAYSDPLTFTNTTNGNGNTVLAVNLTVSALPGALTVTPAGGLAASGSAGGPFAPASAVYTLQNTGGAAINWTAAKTQAWTDLSAAGGTLAAGATATVTVSINTTANALGAGTYADTVAFTNITNGTGSTSRPVTLTVAGPGTLVVTPSGLFASAGTAGGPFAPATMSYTLQNTGGTAINWTAAKTQAWTDLSAASGMLDAGATATVTVSFNAGADSLAAGAYSDTVTFTNGTNGSGNTTRAVSLTVSAVPGLLAVGPTSGLVSSGTQGGPFTPSSIVYTLENTGGTALDWTAAATQSWLTVSPAGGNLAALATTTVTVTVNATANTLTAGPYADTITFTNITDGSGTTTRPVSLTVAAPGALAVTPAGGLASTGTPGGPFSPSSIVYTLRNTGGAAIAWTAAKTQPWLTLSAAGGTLDAGVSTTLIVSINAGANSLAAGAYVDTVTLANTTNGAGNTTRAVSLSVSAAPATLSVTPADGLVSSGVTGGPFSPPSKAYTLQNTGGATLAWTAAATQTWVTLSQASGSLAAGASTTVTVTINASANTLVAGAYADTVTFTNATDGSGTTTRPVSLTVSSAGAMSVSGVAGLTSSGPQGGPFNPSSLIYNLQNTGGSAIEWTAAATQAWTSVLPVSGTLDPGAKVSVTVSINNAATALAAGAYSDTVTFTNATNGTGNTTRAVNLTVTAASARLAVTPEDWLISSGPVGGPFTPPSKVYTLENTGGAALNWTASAAPAWVTLAPASGSLAAGATVTVTATVNATANTLAAGTYSGTMTFANTTNGAGNTTRTASLTVSSAGLLAVSPSAGLASTGAPGGPFTPASVIYTVQNTGSVAIAWTAAKTQAWTTLSSTGGTLNPGSSTSVLLSINSTANGLAAGSYSDTVTFTNTTTGAGNTTRAVSLIISSLPASLAVTPADGLVSTGPAGGPFSPANKIFTLQNTGGVALDWTAAATQGWVALSSAGGNLAAGATTTVTVSFAAAANALATGSYSDTVTFTNTTNGAGTTARPVSLTVSAAGILSVTPAGGLTTAGAQGGPFNPTGITYTLQNTGTAALVWSAGVTQTWAALTAPSGTINPGSSTTVTVYIASEANSLSAGTYTDTVTFTNATNGVGNTTRPVSLTVTAPPGLTVTPAEGLVSTGNVGGPFTPSSVVYTLANTGDIALVWTAVKSQSWLTLSSPGGTLNPGATAPVTVTINSTANALAAGTYSDTVRFTNITNGAGTASRTVSLSVISPGAMTVTPAGGLTTTGAQGGPFNPTGITYTVENAGGTPIIWTASATQPWLNISTPSGGLNPGATASVTVSLNSSANSLAAGTYTDTVTFTNATNGSGNATRPVSLTVAASGAMTVSPGTGLVSTGNAGGPFTPASQAFTLQNTGAVAISWTAVKTQPWVTLSSAGGTLNPGATATVTVSVNSTANSLSAGAYNDTVSFANITNGSGNTTRPVSLTITTTGALDVTPGTGLYAGGGQGGPFTPSSAVYTLQNTGGAAISWTAAKTQTWVTLSASSGTLAPGASADVTVTINSGANSLASGVYSDTVTFTNTTTGQGTTTRAVNLAVNVPGALTVLPAEGLDSVGFVGGPFSPSTMNFTLQNRGGLPINWSAAKTQGWMTVWTPGGTLNPGASAVIGVAVNAAANALTEGTYTDVLTFTNTTNGAGNTTRPVTLTVEPPLNLVVTPDSRDVGYSAGTTTFSVENTGAGTMDWQAGVASGYSWLTVTSGVTGTNSGTVTVSYTANTTIIPRTGTIRILAPDAIGSPKDVTINQTAGQIAMVLSGERRTERAWIIQRDYGRLRATIDNPAAVAVARYVLYRKAAGGSYQAVQELAGSLLVGGVWECFDTFIDSGTTYTYQVVALDAADSVLSQSNEVTL